MDPNDERFEQIRKGMTLEEVEEILGGDDRTLESCSCSFLVVSYRRSDGPGGITIVYKNQRVVSKALLG